MIKAATTKYFYVPYRAGGTIDDDTMYMEHGGDGMHPAGVLIATVDGSTASETFRETQEGRYSARVSYKAARRAFGGEYVTVVRDLAHETGTNSRDLPY